MPKQNWKVVLSNKTETVFSSIDCSKGLHIICNHIKGLMDLKKHHQKVCGLFIKHTDPWDEEMIEEIKRQLEKKASKDFHYTIERTADDPKTIILYT